jgi:hypothetical protein
MLVSAQARKETEDDFLLDVHVTLRGGRYIEVWQAARKRDNMDR